MKRTETRSISFDGAAKAAGHSYSMKVTIDFTDATPEQLMEWAFSNRWIAQQGMLRQLEDFDSRMQEYQEKGITFMATSAATKHAEDPLQVIKRRLENGTMTKEEAREALGL